MEQQQTNVESSNVQSVNETESPSSPQFVNDNVVNQQQSIDSKNFSQMMNSNPFGDSNTQGSESRDEGHSNNSTSRDFSQMMNSNPFGDSNTQGSESRDKGHSNNSTSRDFSQMMNSNPFGDSNTQGSESREKGSSGEFQEQNKLDTNGSTSTWTANSSEENKSDSKENIQKVLKRNHEYYSSTQIEYGKDLAEYIPGLYRLLDLCKDDGSNGLGKFTHVICLKSIKIAKFPYLL